MMTNTFTSGSQHSPAPEPDKGNLEQEETEASQESPAAVEDDITKVAYLCSSGSLY